MTIGPPESQLEYLQASYAKHSQQLELIQTSRGWLQAPHALSLRRLVEALAQPGSSNQGLRRKTHMRRKMSSQSETRFETRQPLKGQQTYQEFVPCRTESRHSGIKKSHFQCKCKHDGQRYKQQRGTRQKKRSCILRWESSIARIGCIGAPAKSPLGAHPQH